MESTMGPTVARYGAGSGPYGVEAVAPSAMGASPVPPGGAERWCGCRRPYAPDALPVKRRVDPEIPAGAAFRSKDLRPAPGGREPRRFRPGTGGTAVMGGFSPGPHLGLGAIVKIRASWSCRRRFPR